eukprot:CAMPEP_0183420756 /NCGR_PEP_ID=MMETSP0370-20130417/26655_1 /TAXON_ID=268820 /ORGANISM="Peridinium aciculiferum, Strain PAER-2" /LENGTH=37 /DNA_ID= /DNA_START= /DNA_END= /DNA_ORIENTATION=
MVCCAGRVKIKPYDEETQASGDIWRAAPRPCCIILRG